MRPILPIRLMLAAALAISCAATTFAQPSTVIQGQVITVRLVVSNTGSLIMNPYDIAIEEYASQNTRARVKYFIGDGIKTMMQRVLPEDHCGAATIADHLPRS